MDIETYIKDHFQLIDSPVNGSSFITPNGLFVSLKAQGYDHIKLIKELAEQGFKVNVDSEQIPEIIKAGWIRCNDGIDNNYAYIELGDITPTEQQFKAMDMWIPFVYNHQQAITVILSTKTDYKEKIYPKDKLQSINRFIRQFYCKQQRKITINGLKSPP